MVDNFDDDLFSHTKMTFGEHLDELRSCLFKAVLSLVGGFLLGLLLGDRVVHMIESPLEEALKKHYQKSTVADIKKKLDERAAAGEKIPEELSTEAGIEEIVVQQGLLFEERFVILPELLADLKKQYPDTFGKIDLPEEKLPEQNGSAETEAANAKSTAAPPGPVKMSRIYLWHHIDDDDRIHIKTMNAQEAFMIYIKAAFIAGAIFSSPLVFYFLWQFVAAGLYPHEKRYVHWFLPASVGLFLFGSLLAFLFVFRPVLEFLFSYNRMLGIDPDPRISEWLSFVLLMPLGFGISFQLPLVMLFLERIGILSIDTYMSKWRISVLVIAIASMVLSPGGDPYSMLMMFIPLTFLYFGGVLLCRLLPPVNRVSRR